MNIDLYLKKLNLPFKQPSLDYLNEIIVAHQRTITFNNLHVFYHPGQILELELEPLFDKVIVREQGGYCFENNKVLFYLLQGLGFNVQPKLGRVIYDKVGDIPRTHRLTIVTLEGERFVADVGFGKDVPPAAIPLDGTPIGRHQIVVDGDAYRLQLNKDDVTIRLYAFDEGFYNEADFNLSNYFTNTHPNSRFQKEVTVSRTMGNVIEFINNRSYTKITDGHREDFEIQDQEEFLAYLKKFGIEQFYDFERVPAQNLK